MDTHYHEILSLPFVDFTLEHFCCWRNLLGVAIKRCFKNTTPTEFIQIVYYQLAIKNYENANYFIARCCQNNTQVRFLKVLLEGQSSFRHGSTNIYYCPFQFLYNTLVDLGIKNYKPAMLEIGSIQIRNLLDDRDDRLIEERKQVLNKLGTIEKSLIETGSDVYNIESIKGHIDLIGSVDERNSYVAMNNVLRLSLAGSNAALLRFLSNLEMRDNIVKVPSFNNLLEAMNKFENYEIELKEVLSRKILEPNYQIISKLLDVYSTFDVHSDNFMYTLDFRALLRICINQLYQYLLKGENHVGTMESYLNFLTKTKMRFDDPYISFCKTVALKCYSKGFLFYHVFSKVNNWKIKKFYHDGSNEELIGDGVSVVANFVTNYFWVRGMCEYVQVGSVFIEARICMFNFLLNISPSLWKVAVCVFGMNLFKTKRSFSREISLLYKKCYYPITWDDPVFIGVHKDKFLWVITGMLLELSNLEATYLEELKEEVGSLIGLDSLREKCNLVLSNINCGKCNNVYDVLLLLAEFDIFSLPYRNILKLHKKYMPGSKQYLKIEQEFDRKKMETVSEMKL